MRHKTGFAGNIYSVGPEFSALSALPSAEVAGSAVRGAFEHLYDANVERIETMALLKLGNVHDAQNAAADVFTAAWRALCSGVAVDVAWLYVALRNVAGNEFRRRDRAGRLDARVLAEYSPVPGGRSDEQLDVLSALSKLDVRDREVLWLVYFEQLPTVDTARVLGLTEAAVRQRATRARSRLAVLLGPNNTPDGQVV